MRPGWPGDRVRRPHHSQGNRGRLRGRRRADHQLRHRLRSDCRGCSGRSGCGPVGLQSLLRYGGGSRLHGRGAGYPPLRRARPLRGCRGGLGLDRSMFCRRRQHGRRGRHLRFSLGRRAYPPRPWRVHQPRLFFLAASSGYCGPSAGYSGGNARLDFAVSGRGLVLVFVPSGGRSGHARHGRSGRRHSSGHSQPGRLRSRSGRPRSPPGRVVPGGLSFAPGRIVPSGLFLRSRPGRPRRRLFRSRPPSRRPPRPPPPSPPRPGRLPPSRRPPPRRCHPRRPRLSLPAVVAPSGSSPDAPASVPAANEPSVCVGSTAGRAVVIATIGSAGGCGPDSTAGPTGASGTITSRWYSTWSSTGGRTTVDWPGRRKAPEGIRSRGPHRLRGPTWRPVRAPASVCRRR